MTTEYFNTVALWFDQHPWLLLALMIWTFLWKGVALWKSAGLRQKYWFTAILLINTVGILEIIYLYFVARKYKLEVIQEKEEN